MAARIFLQAFFFAHFSLHFFGGIFAILYKGGGGGAYTWTIFCVSVIVINKYSNSDKQVLNKHSNSDK